MRGIRTDLDDAAVCSVSRHRHCQREKRPHLIGWRVDTDAGAVAPGRRTGRALHVRACLVIAERSRLEARPGWALGRDAVDPECAPIVWRDVPSQQIPTATPDDQPLRLGSPYGLVAVMVH